MRVLSAIDFREAKAGVEPTGLTCPSCKKGIMKIKSDFTAGLLGRSVGDSICGCNPIKQAWRRWRK